MDNIKIECLLPVDFKDQRGPTREWKFPDGRQITIFERKKGTKFGMHFHRGEDPSKNPEQFYLVSGKISAKFLYQSYQGKKIFTAEECVIKAGSTLTIYPFVYHEMNALEDCVFIEYRITHFDKEKPDTYNIDLR